LEEINAVGYEQYCEFTEVFFLIIAKALTNQGKKTGKFFEKFGSTTKKRIPEETKTGQQRWGAARNVPVYFAMHDVLEAVCPAWSSVQGTPVTLVSKSVLPATSMFDMF
jgi:hypothetical protein